MSEEKTIEHYCETYGTANKDEIILMLEKQNAEMSKALHRLARGFGLGDDGPDDNVAEAIELVATLRAGIGFVRDRMHEANDWLNQARVRLILLERLLEKVPVKVS